MNPVKPPLCVHGSEEYGMEEWGKRVRDIAAKKVDVVGSREGGRFDKGVAIVVGLLKDVHCGQSM